MVAGFYVYRTKFLEKSPKNFIPNIYNFLKV